MPPTEVNSCWVSYGDSDTDAQSLLKMIAAPMTLESCSGSADQTRGMFIGSYESDLYGAAAPAICVACLMQSLREIPRR
jgi:hypothetical protein